MKNTNFYLIESFPIDLIRPGVKKNIIKPGTVMDKPFTMLGYIPNLY